MLDSLKKLLGNDVKLAKGAYNQVNPLDHGKTFADAYRQQIPLLQHPGMWSGITGGDQEFFPQHGFNALPFNIQNKLQRPALKFPYQTAPAIFSPQLKALLGSGIQPNPAPTEDSLSPLQMLQPTRFNNGQVTLNGNSLQGGGY